MSSGRGSVASSVALSSTFIASSPSWVFASMASSSAFAVAVAGVTAAAVGLGAEAGVGAGDSVGIVMSAGTRLDFECGVIMIGAALGVALGVALAEPCAIPPDSRGTNFGQRWRQLNGLTMGECNNVWGVGVAKRRGMTRP